MELIQNSTTSLSMCFVVFSISFEKRNSAAAELVEVVFLALYLFVQIPTKHHHSLLPSQDVL